MVYAVGADALSYMIYKNQNIILLPDDHNNYLTLDSNIIKTNLLFYLDNTCYN